MMWNKTKEQRRVTFDSESVFKVAMQPLETFYKCLQATTDGLSEKQVEERRLLYGKNTIEHEKKNSRMKIFIKAFFNPFIGVLSTLIIISFVFDVLLASPNDKNWTSIIIIAVMVVMSSILRSWQEWKAEKSSGALLNMVTNTCYVRRRENKGEEIEISELVPGDIVMLSAGDMLPADLRIIDAKDLFVSQASLTGESAPIEKCATPATDGSKGKNITELDNICFMGTNVVSGAATGIVFSTGNNTYLGTVAKSLVGHRAATAFDKGISRVSLLLIRFMMIMVPFVFLVNGITKGDWLEAFIFAVSVAVGLTPEMLPMIVTANLSKGAVVMSKKKTIVKDLNAIQNLGAMNILCTDKTGTLTQDMVVLEKYINADGSNDNAHRILRHAYFNSCFQTGLNNLMDKAILSHVKELGMESIKQDYKKIDEIPFDFTRRRMSVVVESSSGKRQIITKGAVEEMLDACSYTELEGQVIPLSAELRKKSLDIMRDMNRSGLRVIAIAQKKTVGGAGEFSIADEKNMVLIGFLAFLDPPKSSAPHAIKLLHKHGIEVKVLSGDNEAVVKNVARQVGIDTEHSVTGAEFEAMNEEEKRVTVRAATIFSRLTPIQKSQIIALLQEAHNTVGFLGDGINDAGALRQSDIGISVDSAVDIAKESADIILLEKDLIVLNDGVVEGRKTFGNIIKYIKMTASSNFGNMFSVMVASAFLPFLPMMPIHLIVQNLLYDLSQTTIPFDHVDTEFLRKPRKWDASDLSRFMICIGPISSVFDIVTYLVMWHIFGCNTPEHQAFFQSGWFIEGLLSQTLIVHMIRTKKIPFLQSHASWQVIGLTLVIIVAGIIIPFSPFGTSIGLEPLPLNYFLWLAGILMTYCIITQTIKNLYVHRFMKWL